MRAPLGASRTSVWPSSAPSHVATKVAVETVESTSFHLVETLAATIGREILAAWPRVESVEVAVRKPEAPMPGPAESVEVRIRLARR